MVAAPQTDAVRHYLEQLFPDPPPEAWLVLSRPDAKKHLVSRWFRATQTSEAVRHMVRQAPRANVYVGLGLRHPDCTPHPDTRGTSADVVAIPGLWIEFDHNAGAHASPHLPTPGELLTFIKALPFTFSLVIDSSGGYHGYCLFKEIWLLETLDDHQAATLLLRRFQRTLQARAAACGWKIDTTSDLARVLRPAGTLNHKTGTPKVVSILYEDAVRYNPIDIADAPWLASIEDTYTPSTRNGSFPPTQLTPIVEGCAWLRHCHEDATTLPEPEWYGMLGIVGRAVEGETIAHEWSAPYPRYNHEETARKLSHALDDAGPATCSSIRYDRGGESYCRECQHWKRIKSPVVLGMARRRRQTHDSGLNSYTPETPYEFNHTENGAPLLDESGTVGLNSLNSLNSYPEWPVMASEAFHGLAGTIVRTIEPHSEADPVALLAQLLTYVGVVIGRNAYCRVEATRHYANMFMCLAGPTSKGRKGTAYDHIEARMKTIDTSWTTHNVSGGCGSGEGVIAAVRDKIVKTEPIRKGGKVTGYQDVMVDGGVVDKRLLIYESEFASVLKIASRDANILSVTLRQCWETGTLRQTVKNNPLRATAAHVALIGHITMEELQRNLTTTEAANGFGNRFLWLCVRRARVLPHGGALHTVDFQAITTRLREVVKHARTVENMTRDDAATVAWEAVYETLSEGKPGLVGALLARGEAQVLRLSMLYALLDGTDTITAEHLYAALAIWEYAEASTAYIFGTTTGDAKADTLLSALKETYPDGLSRTEISTEAFQGNVRADEIDRVIRLLYNQGHLTIAPAPPAPGGKRPRVIVTYTPRKYEINEINEFNHGGYLSTAKDAVKSMSLNSYTVRNHYEFNPETPPNGYEAGII